MTAQLVYKNDPENSMLQFYGQYVRPGDPLHEAIINAGCLEDSFCFIPEIPEDKLEDWEKTSVFIQPKGTDLFAGSTKQEWKENLTRLKAALKPFGITLARPRQLDLAELL